MRISQRLHLVASGAMGLSLTDPLDCNVWMLETTDGLVMFDTGCGRDIASLLNEIFASGLDPHQLRHIFLTHAHADHSGGAAHLRAASLTGLTLHAGGETAKWMSAGDESRINLDSARAFGVYPATYRWQSTIVDDVLEDGATRQIGDVEIRHIETPGHSADHSAYLIRVEDQRLLVSGDAVFAGGTVILQDIPDCSVSASLASIRRLARLSFDVFLPGHGLFALHDGMRHVAKAAEFARKGLVPPALYAI